MCRQKLRLVASLRGIDLARCNTNRPTPGIYLYRLESGDLMTARKMLLIR
jgi:hypothetical protein